MTPPPCFFFHFNSLDQSLTAVWMAAIPPVKSRQAPPSPSLISPVWKPASRILADQRKKANQTNKKTLQKKGSEKDLHLSEIRLGGEPFDRLDQVLVGISVTGQDLTEQGDHRERILSVDPMLEK